MSATLDRPPRAVPAARRSTTGRGWIGWTAAGLVLGALLALAYWSVQPASWSSRTTVALTGDDAPGRGSLFEINGGAQDDVGTVAAVAGSDVVTDGAARRLGLPPRSLRGSVSAEARAGTLVIDITVTSTTATDLVRATDAIALTTSEQTQILQALNGGTVRTQVEVVTPASDPVDGHLRSLGFTLVIGVVVGAGLGATAGVLRRPVTREQRASAWDLDADVRAELAGWAVAARRRPVRLAAAGALLLLLGYAVTGSPWPAVVLGLALSAAGFRDLRWPAVGLLLLGLGAPDPRIVFLPLGPITLSVQDVLLLAGLAALARTGWLRRGRGPGAAVAPVFGPALLALVGAVLLGGVVGLLRGAGQAELAEPMRIVLAMPAFWLLFRAAWAGRPAQLLLTLLATSFLGSSLVLLAVPLGWTALLGDVRDYVVTGTTDAAVTRLADPVLVVWSVLLVVLAAGVAVGTRRWPWLLAAAPGVVHVALSFNRSTWAPLLVVVVLAAGLRGGRLGMVRRLLVVVVVGAVGMSVALSGSLGFQAEQLGTRALSAVTGAATEEDSLSDRLIEDDAAVATLEADPLLGTGLGRPYGGRIVVFDPSQDATVVVDRPYIHNQYFRLWLLFGVAGLAALTWVLVRLAGAVTLLVRSVGTARSAVPVAVALGLLCTGMQGIFQTNLIDRPTMLLAGVSFALVELCVRACVRSAPPTSPAEDHVRRSA